MQIQRITTPLKDMLDLKYIKSHIVDIIESFGRLSKKDQGYDLFNVRLCFAEISKAEIRSVIDDFIDFISEQDPQERYNTIMSLQTVSFQNQLQVNFRNHEIKQSYPRLREEEEYQY